MPEHYSSDLLLQQQDLVMVLLKSPMPNVGIKLCTNADEQDVTLVSNDLNVSPVTQVVNEVHRDTFANVSEPTSISIPSLSIISLFVAVSVQDLHTLRCPCHLMTLRCPQYERALLLFFLQQFHLFGI